MSITWRMEVKDETFTNLRDHPSVGQNYITPNAGVASLDSFSVDNMGNCLEARFRASPQYVDIRPRDIVSLEISTDGGSTWSPVYRGYVVTAGNKRSKNLEQYKLVGLYQRFYEITNPRWNIPEGDVGTQAAFVFDRLDAAGDWPAGVVNTEPTVPTFNFVNGIRYPNKESYGDTLQALADSVGRFVVPVGGSYTFDGVTYAEGETVLGAKWGVDGAGNAFFSRPQGSNVVVSESADNVLADFVQVTGEEVFDVVELIYATENEFEDWTNGLYVKQTGTPTDRVFAARYGVPIPLTRQFTFGTNGAVRKVVVPSPLSLMTSDMTATTLTGTVTNPTGAITGGTTTLGSSGTNAVIYDSAITDAGEGFIVRFTLDPTSTSSTLVVRFGSPRQYTGGPLEFGSVRFSFSDYDASFGTSARTYLFTVLPLANDLFPLSVVSNNEPFDAIATAVSFEGVDMDIEDVEIYVPDVDDGGTKSEQFASGFVRDTTEDVAAVQLFGEFGVVAPRMDFTPVGESSVVVPIERVEYRLTTRDGLVTAYELGQAYDAELLSERAVLKSLAREAVSQ